MPYRSGTVNFSNRYFLTGGAFADNTHRTAFAAAVAAAEKTIYVSNITIISSVFYDAGSEVPVWTVSQSIAGTFTPAGDSLPGDCAAVIRYSTAARSTKNHPIYLYNYYHGVMRATSDQDTITPTLVTAYDNYATDWVSTGFSDGSTTRFRAGPRSAAATGFVLLPWVRHRDFPA